MLEDEKKEKEFYDYNQELLKRDKKNYNFHDHIKL